MISKHVFLVLLLFMIRVLVSAQSVDTVQLRTIDINSSRTSLFSPGIQSTLKDTSKRDAFKSANLSELLQLNSNIFIKSNGSGGSATITSRGTEARHNAVLWHGFNINSASLGLSDFSIIPSMITDNVNLMHGGSSAVNGNSAIGSVVVLDNPLAAFEKHNATSIVFEGGSFGNIHGNLSTVWGNHFMDIRTSLFYDEAQNDFKYVNITQHDKPEEEQQHASYSNYGLLQDFQFRLTRNQFLRMGLWYQVTERELPALMMVPQSYADQSDSNWRVFTDYRIEMKKSVLTLKGAAFNEFQKYNDSRYDIHSDYHVHNYFGEGEYRYYVNDKLILNSGVSYNHASGDFKEYSGTKQRITTSLFLSGRYSFNKYWHTGLSLRQEFSNITSPPVAPYITVEGNVYKDKFLFLIQAGRHFSLPSMNDLYWVPGGNPELKPEYGWSEELSFIFYKNQPRLPSVTLTAFNSLIDNWIKWQPAAGGLYTPSNLSQVHARGAEALVNYTVQVRNFHLRFATSYAWCRSTLKKSTHPGDGAVVDKQLVYIPEHVFNLNFTLTYLSWGLYFSNSYIGERFVTADNKNSLDAYSIGNLSLEKNFQNRILPASIYFKIMNLYNTTYQVMAYQPTPGTWYSAGVKLNFSVPYKSKQLIK